jgi:hypothetical protein
VRGVKERTRGEGRGEKGEKGENKVPQETGIKWG